MPALILALLLACNRADPELSATREVLDRWTAGKTALDAGDLALARLELEAAGAARPGDPVLLAWTAKAFADAGDLPGALERIDQALALAPQFPEARYNRAAWLARTGRPDDAGPELKRALEARGIAPREALLDPDFTPWLAHPAFAFLPSQQLTVAVDAVTSPVFWGSEFPFRVRILGASGPVEVKGSVRGPVEVVAAVTEVAQSTDGPVRDITWAIRVLGAGEAELGPLTIRSGSVTSSVEAVRLRCEAPEGRAAGSPASVELWDPDALAAAWPTPSAVRADGLLWVKAAAGDRVTLTPPAGAPTMRLEHRENGDVGWQATGWSSGPAAVRVVRLGQEVFAGQVE